MAETKDVVFKRLVIGGSFVKVLTGELAELNRSRLLKEVAKPTEAELKNCEVEEKNVRRQIVYLFMVWAEVVSKDATFSRSEHKLIDKIETALEKAIVEDKKPVVILTNEEFALFSTRWNAFKLWGGGKEIRIYTRALGSVLDSAEGISTLEAKSVFEDEAKEVKVEEKKQ